MKIRPRKVLLVAPALVGILALSGLAGAADMSPWTDHPENVWVKRSPREGAPAPGFLYEGSGDFDPHSNQWIHHAGHDGIPQGFHTFTCDLATGAWRQRFPPTSPPGVCCVDGANVFDPANRRFVRFPGGSLGHGYQWSRGVRLKESAVWLYDPVLNTWMNMRPPPYREPEKYSKEVIGGLCSGGTYVANPELVVSFGGSGAGGAKNNLYFYDAYANALHLISASNAPPARDGMGLAYDAARDQLVMFGSQYLSDERTWFYDFHKNAWEAHELNPHPPGLKTGTYSTIPRMACDPVNDVVLCLVWLGEKGGHETWALDTGRRQWTKLNPATEPAPSKSRSRNLTFSPEHNLFMLELSSTNNRPELWTYRYKKITAPRLAPPTHLEVVTSAGTATLKWTASSSQDVNGYEIYRAAPARPWLAEFQKIGTTTGTTYEDRDIVAGAACFYKVKTKARDGSEGSSSLRARAQPRVLLQPTVSALATNRIEVSWNTHPAKDITGYNIYRGLASVKTVKKGEPGAWKDNDPEYAEPQIVKVTDITNIQKLNLNLLRATNYTDRVDLGGKESGDYKFTVYAYIVHAVNKLGIESGPSPYALTIPSEPVNVLCREKGDTAELKWDASPEKGIAGYRIYKLKGTWEIVPIGEALVRETNSSQPSGRNATRYWVVAVDALGQEGQPSSPVWCNQSYRGFYAGEWHQ